MTYKLPAFRTIANISLPDGVIFNDEVKATIIRDAADEYAGIRIRLVGVLGRSRVTIGIDVNFGDPISPEPQLVEVPRIIPIEQPPVVLLGYPLEMVLAEKIVTAIDRGEGNTRWRDFADVYTLIGLHPVAAQELQLSMGAVSAYRNVDLRPLLPELEGMPVLAQAKWNLWRVRVGRELELPAQFDELLQSVARFADPVLSRQATGHWNNTLGRWVVDSR